MQGKNIARRRGTSVAAAALSFALVAPFAQPVAAPQFAAAAYAGTPAEAGQPDNVGNGVKYPGENAQGVYQSVVNEQAYTFTDQPIKVEGAIDSTAPEGTNESINGYVIHQRDGDLSVYPGTRDPWKPIPMAGVRVYAQWTEKGGITSPVYTTTTREDGRYTIHMKPFNNAKGEVVKFDADPNGPQYEKIRVWVDNPDTDKFTQLYGYNFGHMGPNGNTYDTPGGMSWWVGSDRVMNARFAFGEKTRHDLMHLDKADQNPAVGNGPGQIQGKLFWHLFHTQGAFTPNLMNLMNGADVPATGMKVYGSYLSDYAVNEIYEKAAIDLGFDEIRGSGWTNRNETALQNWIKRKIAEEGKDKWIAETAEATVGSDGKYTLQFRGTFGRNPATTVDKVDRGYDDGALLYTDLARDNGAEAIFPDGSKHNAYNLFGQVAPAADVGSWRKAVTGRGIDNMPKHVNWNWLFFSTEETEGLGQFTPFYNNSFLPRSQYVFNGAGKWAGGLVYGAGDHYLKENRHVIYSDYTVFDVLDYDTHEHPAKPGDVVETKTGGLPTQWVDGMQYAIEWVDGDTGKVVKTCDAVGADANGTIPSCQLDTSDENLFPGGITKTTTFTAYLYPVSKETGARGQAIAADAFTVLTGWQPLYERTEAPKAGEQVTSQAPTFDNTDTEDDVEKLTAEELTAKDADKQPTGFKLADGFKAPKGYTVRVDRKTGEVSVTFPKHAPYKSELEVPVQVTYKDKTTAVGSARFVLTSKQDADKVEPQYEDGTGKPGEDAKVPAPEFKEADDNGDPTDKPADKPEGVEFHEGLVDPEDKNARPKYVAVVKDEDGNEQEEEKDLPKGSVTVDKETGEISVKVPEDAKPGSEFTVPVKVTYPDGSEDTVDVTVEVEKNDNEKFEPEYQDENGKPGEDVTVGAPSFTDDAGDPAEKPEGTTFKKGEDAPEGVTVNEDGSVKVTIPEGAEPGTKIEVPVVVTYPDGSTDEKTVTVTVVPKDNEAFDPEYKEGKGTPGKDAKVDAPTFKDKDGKETKAPTGTKFAPDTSEDKAPKYTDKGGNEKPLPSDNVKVDPNTGEVTVTVPEDAAPDSKITVPVKVTYPDGSEDTTDVTVTVGTPNSDDFEPEYKEGDGKPGKDAEVPAPTFKDKDGNETKAPEGTTFGPDDSKTPKYTDKDGNEKDLPSDNVKVDPNTGEVTVTVPGDAKPDTKITVPVKVTYPDGSEDTTDVTVSVGKPDPSVNTDGADSTVPANDEPHVVGKVENPTGDEKGKLVDKDGKEIPGSKVEIDEKTGEIKVTVPEGTDPQDAKVIITDKDGKKIGEIDVKIVDPNYGEPTKVEAGKKESSKNPFGENGKAPEGTTATGTPSEGSDDWTFTTDPKSGVVEAQSPSYEKVGEKIREELPKLPEIKSAEPGDRWKKFVEDFTPFVKPSVDVEFTYPGGSKDKATADFDLVGKDGKSLLDPDGDFDGDGASNKEEIEKGSNPADEKDVPDTTAPKVNPIKPGDKKITGTDDRPNTEITVTFPGGKTVTTTTDENGNWSVDVPSDVDLKTGDKVTVTDGAGNSTEAKVGIDTGKCVATTLGFGLPLIALLPIGLATQMDIPGVTPIANEISARLEQANSQIQQQLGIFNPQVAGQVAEINARLKEVGGDLSMVAAGIALIAAGILAGTLIYDNCSPDGGFNSSVKDLELKGSSGKTHELSSKKQGEDKKSSAEK